MTPGFRVSNGWQRPDTPLIEVFKELPTAIISDNMHRLFAAGVSLRPIHRQGTLCGSAFTVRTRPGDNLMVHKALDLAQPGDGSEEHTSELQSPMRISYAVFCLKKKITYKQYAYNYYSIHNQN